MITADHRMLLGDQNPHPSDVWAKAPWGWCLGRGTAGVAIAQVLQPWCAQTSLVLSTYCSSGRELLPCSTSSHRWLYFPLLLNWTWTRLLFCTVAGTTWKPSFPSALMIASERGSETFFFLLPKGLDSPAWTVVQLYNWVYIFFDIKAIGLVILNSD